MHDDRQHDEGTAVTYVLDGRTERFEIEGDEITIGRLPENDLVIPHRSVSRHHAKLVRREDGWRVEDLGSLNGTRVNRRDDLDRPLRNGDVIHLYDFALRFKDGATTSVHLLDDEEDDPSDSTQTTFRDPADFGSLASRPGRRAEPRTAETVDRLQRVVALVSGISESIVRSESLDATFERVLEVVFRHLPVDRGLIMLHDPDSGELQPRCVRHRDPTAGDIEAIRFSSTVARKVVGDKVAVLITDARSDARFAEQGSILAMNVRSAIAAPVWTAERVDGLIFVDTPHGADRFDESDLDLLSAVGHSLGAAVERERLERTVLRQRMLRRSLERYHSPAVIERVRGLLGSGDEALVAEDREVTVVFADMAGFSSRAESLEPRETANLLNRYFSALAEQVFRHQGTLDKFIGDCLMAVFGAPISDDEHAARAARCAIDMREAVRALNADLPDRARVRFRVGMHSGRVVAGDFGSPKRRDYTVLGANVNIAARIESFVARPGQIVMSDATERMLDGAFRTAELGTFELKGISNPVRCHELLGHATSGDGSERTDRKAPPS